MNRRRVGAMMTALAVGGAALTPSAVWATPTTQVIEGDVIRLVSVADWDAAASLLPGDAVRWDVAVSADAPDPGTVRIAVSARGDAPLTLDVSLCPTEWTPTGCPGGATSLRTAWSIPRDGDEVPLTEIADTEIAHVRLAISLDPSDRGVSTDIRLHAHGAGESVVVGADGGLATTGPSPVVPGALVGGVLLTLVGAAHIEAGDRS